LDPHLELLHHTIITSPLIGIIVYIWY